MLCSDKDAGPELELTLAGLRVYDELEERLGERGAHPPQGRADRPPRRADVGGRGRRASSACAPPGCRAACSTPRDVRALEPELTGELRGASFFPADLQCAPRAIARALAARPAARAHRRRGARRSTVARRRGDRRCARATARCRAARWSSPPAPWSARSPRRPGVALPLEPRKGQLVRLRAARARRAPHPPQGRRGRLPGLGGERRRGPAGHDACSRRRGRATCSSAPAASAAASTSPSTTR